MLLGIEIRKSIEEKPHAHTQKKWLPVQLLHMLLGFEIRKSIEEKPHAHTKNGFQFNGDNKKLD